MMCYSVTKTLWNGIDATYKRNAFSYSATHCTLAKKPSSASKTNLTSSVKYIIINVDKNKFRSKYFYHGLIWIVIISSLDLGKLTDRMTQECLP